ncbi:Ig-like domain-containing protein [Edwardsiella anguillarum]|uniref:Ig-like domain-containing protein n=1 Tax=Edwardsiella anguillarum TaxID=1821960 RepID=UPI0024B8007E|nr:Ig-like domain-containing protein [Edwardsiella anguillarum]WHP81288.1 Ig-like domain-containing protein [Edwardsiella anguillarum]WHQ18789.1 Ig-like domain-containing protein [Edwardsiella anguillarum]WHQ22331.1 Ig-like domain-containing protein [Edwardsiella anguillarum]WHQ25853.1 Ig-like domain-containing protein [Edwardsiella anguillarum]WHQ29376.1 Ig-like domain-containing protein [Edwardsiella anguillarum]
MFVVVCCIDCILHISSVRLCYMNPKIVRFSAKLCLGIQLAVILPGTIFPVAALAKSERRTLFSSQTALYTLKSGETVAYVAKKFNVTVPELKKINEFRKYNKPFEQLGAGDELDVPVSTKSVLTPDNGNGSKATKVNNDVAADFWASAASTVGGVLSSDNAAHSATSMAKGMAVGAANSEIEDWLSQFGTAKVQLNVDDNFHLDGSSIDLLFPLYDNSNHLLFTQWGYRNKDSRNTINIGLGARTFQGNWMYGVNAFFDDDLTGHNRRVGFGIEAWTDYLKLAANSYSGITDWHQSRDFSDYDERPADGFDIRAEGYLPMYPQLGAKLMYEQYRGKEVALFSKDERQKDPKAVTLGINYTPIPLLTVGVDHRYGQGGHSDTQINFEMNYRLGVPWSQQVESDNVDIARTLAGSRYDLVDRNNDIVLEYKKQTLIQLSLPDVISGNAGDTDHITATVKAKYGTQRIDWDTGEILAAGGQANTPSKQVLNIVYPPFNASGNNTYHVSAVAVDSKGNTSNRGVTEIRVSEPDASLVAGNLVLTRDGAKADGYDTNAVKAKVTDNTGRGVAGQQVSFSVDNTQAAITTDPITTDSNGVAETTLTSTVVGIVNITARVNGSTLSIPSTFIADTASATVSRLDADKETALANDTDKVTFTATLNDAGGNPVEGVVVNFATDKGTLDSATGTTDASGIATTTLHSTEAGAATVTATTATDSTGQSKGVNFTADAASATVSRLDADKETALANDTDKVTFTATLNDAGGNPVEGVVVNFATDKGTLDSATGTTNASGIATTTLHSTEAGAATVTATTATDSTGQSKGVNFTADAASATVSRLDADKETALANDTDKVTFTATLNDAGGNPVEGVVVNFATDKGTLDSATGTTDASGIATTTLHSTEAGAATVTATTATDSTGQSKGVNFTADAASATVSRLDADKETALANDTDKVTFTATLNDAGGNPVEGVVVNFATDKGTLDSATGTTNASGIATTTLHSTEAGAATVTATTATDSTGQSKGVNFTADAASATVSRLDADKETALANDTDKVTFTATLNDAGGNPVEGVVVNFATDKGTLDSATGTTDASGIATTTLHSTEAGAATVTATTATDSTGQSKGVNFTADAASATVSRLDADKETALANDTDKVTFTATLNDAGGNPVEGVVVNFATDKGTLDSATGTTNASGIATTTLHSTEAGAATVTATTATDSTGQSKGVNFTADAASATVSRLDADKETALANDTDKVTFTATLNDAGGNPVEGVVVNFATDKGTLDSATGTTDASGIATTTLHSTEAGAATVTATTATDSTGQSKGVNFTADAASATVSRLDADKETALANDTDKVTFTATLNDAGGNPVEGVVVNFATDKGTLDSATGTTNASGIATTTLHSTEAGAATVTATTATDSTGQSKGVNFTADAASATVSRLDADKETALANDTDKVTFTATLNDAGGNPVEGVVVNFATDKGTLDSATGTTDASGIATTTLHSTEAGAATVTATTATDSTGQSKGVNFTADAASATVSRLDADKETALANDTDKVTFTATLNDAGGNPVEGVVVNFATDKGTLDSATGTTDASGIATTTLHSTEAGAATVTATTATDSTGQSKGVNFTADAASAKVSSLVPDRAEAPANGVAPVTFVATLVDGNNNILADKDVSFTVLNASAGGIPALSATSARTGADGTASITVTDSTVETVTITAKSVDNASSSGVDASTSFTEVVAATLKIETVGSDNAFVEGGVVKVKVTAMDSIGNAAPGVALTFTGTNVINRQGMPFSSGELLLDGTKITAANATTGADGSVIIDVTDPDGKGVQTTLNVLSGSVSANTDIHFSIITSPDTAKANMWGHMVEVASDIKRPLLKSEFSSSSDSISKNNEVWAGTTYAEAIEQCGSEANIPTADELSGLHKTYGDTDTSLGWPDRYYRSSTASTTTGSPDYHDVVFLSNGQISDGIDTNRNMFTACH